MYVTRSYLSWFRKFLMLDKATSLVTTVFPQGSILGPLHFYATEGYLMTCMLKILPSIGCLSMMLLVDMGWFPLLRTDLCQLCLWYQHSHLVVWISRFGWQLLPATKGKQNWPGYWFLTLVKNGPTVVIFLW